MRRTVTSVVLLALVLFGGFGRGLASGQDSASGTPVPNSLPPGVTASTLGSQEMGPLPPVPAWVGLARFTYDAGVESPEQVVPGPTLFIVETGTISFELGGAQGDDPATPTGQSPALDPGDQFYVPANASYSSRNESGALATALRVVIHPSAPVITPIAGLTYQLLAGGVADSLPDTAAWATVSRVSLATGAAITESSQQPDDQAEDEPDLFLLYIESGLISLALPGAEVVIAPGGTAVIQANSATALRNAAPRPSVFLVLTLSSVPPQGSESTPAA